MFKNYFKTTIRNLRRNKGFAFINIAGLAVGMAAAILILLWAQNELSTDRFYKNESRIYEMYNRDKDAAGNKWAWPNTPKILATTLKNDYPEVEDAVRYNNVTFLLTQGEKHLNVQGAFADSGFLNVFDFPLKEGVSKQCLGSVYNIVLTEKLAKKFFGNENAIGKTVRIDSVHNCTVTAVLKDLPPNTQFNFEYLLPWSYMDKIGWSDSSWGNNSVFTYALLKPGVSQAAFDAKIKDITINHTKGSSYPSSTDVFTQPLSRAYLYSKSENGKLSDGPIKTVRLFLVIAVFILLIACINFMNLSTARSEKRAREVGIRKVLGAQRIKLIFQFIGESILFSLGSFLIALFIVKISLSGFNTLVNKELAINYSDPVFWLFAIAFVLISGILAGMYPAFFLSAFKPVKVLKGTFKKAEAAINPRKVLVVVQFTFAIVLIISTLIIQKQIQHTLDRDAGYNRNNLVYIFGQGDIDKNFTLIKNDLLKDGSVVSITRSSNPITRRWSDSWGFIWPGSTKQDEKTDFVRLGADADFVKTIGVKLIAGRDIDVYNYPTDSTAVLLNETAVKSMRLENPVGTIIKSADNNTEQWHVVGVVKDFILESPYQKDINPMIIFGPAGSSGYVLHLKLNPANSTASNLAKMEKVFKEYNPQYPFEYVFADESYARKFDDTRRTSKLSSLFAGLTIFISCLGLFALAAYSAENRLKEIGVRKVLGASVFSITSLMSKDFLKLVIISFAIASPIAWFAMHKWLDGYSYRIAIQWWIFALAGLISVLIASATIIFHVLRAAIANPVNSLRTE
ncbi:MAG: ABC transporter permease [Bacteroidetes bacterium]|nr:ABC transporter permease [Bacteroidota bacterium]MBS1634010.1 ABC transporter permease [Bacteroidota bacterium]